MARPRKKVEPIGSTDLDRPLNRKDLKRFKSLLSKERDAVLNRLGSHVGSATGEHETLADEADQASRATNQAYLLRLADKEHKLVTQIDRALRKIDDGSYGTCEGTGEPIERKRLGLRPWTRYSLQYKEMLEKEERNRRYKQSGKRA